ncbi:BTAD domain-containing putative transcriptional regulator [Streptomyces sp. NBC_01304]|uniref:BTAD domain-containing putative transcriptional regulator n=1 Tax=Streptomyces sp. NBC_01304 TaxID=2903818 RepID=UPI002E12595F|nr:AAA family ATPase [Streptomyces sp. NBC_01304]
MTHRYLVLGTTQALRRDGTAVPLGGARLRALLAALAVSCGRAVPLEQLAAQVWSPEEEPPADQVKALQALVGRLRRVLGTQAVASVPGGYRLVAERDDVDLFRFERLAGEGTRALDGGEAGPAAGLFEEALALWRGPALLDLPGRAQDPAVVRAERRRFEARRGRLAAEVALGRAEAALDELAALAAEAPLDEPVQALRLRALRDAGRSAQALAAYEETRRLLVARLGANPGPELRQLHAELLNPTARPAPESTGPRSRTPHTRAVRGNLRARLSSFVGRETELAAVAQELRQQRLVTLLGPGGVGKTRLALEAAEAVREAWPDGVWVVELAAVQPEKDAPGTAPRSTEAVQGVAEVALTALGARETAVRGAGAADELATAAVRDPPAQLVEQCGRRRMLLVLDNCEHVIGAAAELAQALLTSCPGVTVLATSREPLGVPGEIVRPVEPLPKDVALLLLGERGAAARPGFRIEDDAEACAEICVRLDGLPLAVELAAARLRALTARQLADRLDDRFRLLAGGSRTALPRQQTLRAVVDWSWDLLDAAERTVLRRLALFSDGCALEQAEEVCGAGADVVQALASLVDKSLVIAVPDGPDGMRYRLLETVAEYAAERLAEAGEREAVARRHLIAYRELMRTGEPELRGPRQARWLTRFEAEHGNVRAALRTAVELREEQEGLCLALSMSWFWQLRGHQADALQWSGAVAGLGPDPFAEPLRVAAPLGARCTDEPPPWDEEQLWEARRGVHLVVRATSHAGAGDALADPGAQAELGRIVAAYRRGQPQTCRQPGSMWYFARLMTGGLTGLEETMDAVVADCRALVLTSGQADGARDFGWDLGYALLMRAKLLYDRPDALDRAGRDADEALRAFERAGDPWGIAESLSARGEAAVRHGRYADAARDFEGALEGAARIGAHSQVPAFQARLAQVRLRTAVDRAGRDGAERLLLDAARDADRFGGEPFSTARLLLAQHYGGSGRTGAAHEQLDALERAFPPDSPELFVGALAGVRGWLDCLDGEFARAERRLKEAVRRMSSVTYLVAPHLVIDQFLCAAWAKAALGTGEDGARLLGAFDRGTAGGGLGFRPFPDQAEPRERAEAALRAALDEGTYRRTYAEGGDLSVREAADLV